MTADVIGRGLHFGLILAAQQALGPAVYGYFALALATGFVLAAITDLGLPLVVTRQIARREHDPARIAGTSLTLKLALVVPAVVVVAAVALGRPGGIRLPTLLLGCASLAMSLVEFVGYVLRGLGHVDQETGLLLLLRITAVLGGAWALWSGHGLVGFAAAYLTGVSLALVSGILWLTGRHFVPRFGIDRMVGRALLRQALPLGGANVLSVAYTRTGLFVLDAMNGPVAVGVYGVAQKLTEPLALLPAALLAPTFPGISQDTTRSGEGARMRVWVVRRLAVAGAVLAAGGALVGPWVIGALYSEAYAGAAVVLQVLALAILPTFINFGLTHFLVAEGRTRLNLSFNAVMFVTHLGLCVWLAPRAGGAGVAASVLASELVLLVLCWRALAGRRLAGPGGDLVS